MVRVYISVQQSTITLKRSVMKIFSNRTGGIPALLFAVLLVLGFSVTQSNAQYYDDNYNNNGYYDDYGDYQEFYDDLAPYGQWINDPMYGYVWTPNAGRDFRPYYSNGNWVMTEYGNMWVSNYAWGWAPFHYGRWAQSAYYGWIWIPGRTWGPAWVVWRQGGGYYGWAPMGPGISINVSFGSGYNMPSAWWTFIPCNYIYSRSYSRYYSPRRTVNIINNTTIINNTYVERGTRNTYVSGPRRSDVETATRRRVTVYNVNNSRRSGAVELNGRNVNVYRPSIPTSEARGNNRSAPRQAKTVERSVITNAGGGRAPSRPAVNNESRQSPASGVQAQPNSRAAQLQQRNTQIQQREAQQRNAREQQLQVERDRQQRAAQQERVQRESAEQQRMIREQQRRQQAEQQQRVLQDQQRARQQQAEQQQRMQREQQLQQQRSRTQQAAQQQRMQREQQVQQQRIQQQRNTERAVPQRVERSNSAPQQRSVERSPRGR